jgi:predicted HicB family RNase H-like nuclease
MNTSRPKKPPRKAAAPAPAPKAGYLHLVLSPEEHARVRAAAEADGRSMTSWATRAVLAAAAKAPAP